MDIIKSIRSEKTSTHIISNVFVNGQSFGVFLEPPDKMNENDISCILTGDYLVEKYMSNRFKRICLKVREVYKRTNISIHNGNFINETQGCLIVGFYAFDSHNGRAVMDSRNALASLVSKVGDVSRLIIREGF